MEEMISRGKEDGTWTSIWRIFVSIFISKYFITGLAIKIDEYVPTITPIINAKAKFLITSPPTKNNTATTHKSQCQKHAKFDQTSTNNPSKFLIELTEILQKSIPNRAKIKNM